MRWLTDTLGIIFAPCTTVKRLASNTIEVGIACWDWLWIDLGVVLDIMKWCQVADNRR